MAVAVLGATSLEAGAVTYQATPSSYRELLRKLDPGDVLVLGPGEYGGLPLHGLHGRADAFITVAGQSEQTVILAARGRNTVSVKDSSYLVVRDMVLDGRNLPTNGLVCERDAEAAHHIVVEGLTIQGFGMAQSTVGIATRCSAWGWEIRRNRIVRPGTGMYLGNSDGSAPFFASTIEGNEIVDPIGYGIQIKHQVARPAIEGMPTLKSVTVIRGNRITKSEGASTGKDARPSLLVGHFPLMGHGMDDLYLIHSNVLYDNPTEALFQGEGNLALYNNLLVNPRGDAVHIQPHNARPRTVLVFNNTVVAAGIGIAVHGAEAGFQRYVGGNAVFADSSLRGFPVSGNLVGSRASAANHFVRPDGSPSTLDLTPHKDSSATAGDLPPDLVRLPEAMRDFRGVPRSAPVFGACVSARSTSDQAACR